MTRTVKLWWIASGIMTVLFAFTCLLDFLRMNQPQNMTSAPYWAFVAARAVEFLFPAIIFALIAIYLQLRHKKSKGSRS